MRSVTTLGTKERYANQAQGYVGNGPHAVAADSFDNSWIGAAGNLVATVDDLIAWDRFLFGGAGQLFLPMMATPAVLADCTTVGDSIGLFVGRQAGHRLITHCSHLSGLPQDQDL